MIPKSPAQYVLGALGDVAGSALFRSALKYWWVTVPVGYITWASIKERKKRKELTPLYVVGDVAPVVTLVATLVLLNHTLDERERLAASAAVASSIPPSTIKDASFTTTPAT